MANEVEDAVKKAATSVADYVKNVAVLTVDTKFVEVGQTSFANFDQAAPAARTVIRLDGDCEVVAPMRKNAAGVLEVDADLFQLHQANVQTAIDYRARLLDALLSVIKKP